jgi:hypothetical protein
MGKRVDQIPPERRKQFDLAEVARKGVLEWARAEQIPLEHIEYVVSFVETDFSLWAVFFYRTRKEVAVAQGDGTSNRVLDRFKQALAEVGYGEEWLALVTCDFASKDPHGSAAASRRHSRIESLAW